MTDAEIQSLLDRLQSYLAQMAPHQKVRQGGQLLVQSEIAIRQLMEEMETQQEELP